MGVWLIAYQKAANVAVGPFCTLWEDSFILGKSWKIGLIWEAGFLNTFQRIFLRQIHCEARSSIGFRSNGVIILTEQMFQICHFKDLRFPLFLLPLLCCWRLRTLPKNTLGSCLGMWIRLSFIYSFFLWGRNRPLFRVNAWVERTGKYLCHYEVPPFPVLPASPMLGATQSLRPVIKQYTSKHVSS